MKTASSFGSLLGLLPSSHASIDRFLPGTDHTSTTRFRRVPKDLIRAVFVVLTVGYLTSSVSADCIDYGTPPQPAWLGQANTPASADDVVFANGYAYTTANGVRVINVSNPQSPQAVGHVPTHSQPRALAIAWPYVYVAGADFEESFDVVDVSNPSSPSIVGTAWGTGYFPTCAAAYGTHVYVGIYSFTFGSRVTAFDVSDPAHPGPVSSVDMEDPEDIAISGTHAYVPNGGAGLSVLDLSNPATPVIAGNAGVVGFARGNRCGRDTCVCLCERRYGSSGVRSFEPNDAGLSRGDRCSGQRGRRYGGQWVRLPHWRDQQS